MTRRPVIVASETLHETALELLRAAADLIYEPDLHADRKRLGVLLGDADALLVRNQTRVDGELLAGASLKAVGRVGVGLDNLDLEALRARGITATWAPGTNAASVAEYVMGAALTLARLFLISSPAVHGGNWDRRAATGTELRGKTLGVVGLGDIGARTARRARAFGMNVVASDPQVGSNSFAAQEIPVELVPLSELLARSHFVSLHAPLVPATRKMMDADSLSAMRPGSYLINTARGGLVDEDALAHALGTGHLAGAALDVRDPEPPVEGDPLAGLPNVLLTPHIAGVTDESLERACVHVAEDVLRVLDGRRPVSEIPGG